MSENKINMRLMFYCIWARNRTRWPCKWSNRLKRHRPNTQIKPHLSRDSRHENPPDLFQLDTRRPLTEWFVDTILILWLTAQKSPWDYTTETDIHLPAAEGERHTTIMNNQNATFGDPSLWATRLQSGRESLVSNFSRQMARKTGNVYSKSCLKPVGILLVQSKASTSPILFI